MPNYRRNYVPGGTYFFTVVTHERRPILTTEIGRASFHIAFEEVKRDHPFTAFASVLLPDHFHCVWILPPEDADYSTRWGLIKEKFTRKFMKAGGSEGQLTASRRKHRERAIWQKRFWEHTILDANDLERCVDDIHWNPVKHGYVQRPGQWQWSTFASFIQSGDYPSNWGESEIIIDVPGAEWE